MLTALATAGTRSWPPSTPAPGRWPLAAPGHQVAAVVGGYDRAFLIAGAFAAGASLVSMAAARSRRAAPSSRAPKRRPEHSSCRAGAR